MSSIASVFSTVSYGLERPYCTCVQVKCVQTNGKIVIWRHTKRSSSLQNSRIKPLVSCAFFYRRTSLERPRRWMTTNSCWSMRLRVAHTIIWMWHSAGTAIPNMLTHHALSTHHMGIPVRHKAIARVKYCSENWNLKWNEHEKVFARSPMTAIWVVWVECIFVVRVRFVCFAYNGINAKIPDSFDRIKSRMCRPWFQLID